MEVLRASSFWRDLKGIIDYFDGIHVEDAALRFLDAVTKPSTSSGNFRTSEALGSHLVSDRRESVFGSSRGLKTT